MQPVDRLEARNNRHIAAWLLVCCALIFAMVVLGGVTRLTRSGLSMVEWDPIMGVIPPLTEAQWQETFEKYKRFPEYEKVNRHLDLDGFKKIFLVEYSHRILGRSIGVVFLIPFLYFLIRRKIKRWLAPRLITMFVLGGLQGLLGWYMVKSGLVDKPHVSQYRLTAHLGMAVLIYGYILWVAWGLLYPLEAFNPRGNDYNLWRMSLAIMALVFVMILSGGFVAGTRAGFVFNTFPLMYDSFIPPGAFSMQPLYINFFENVATIQLTHRLLAYALCIAIPLFWVRVIRRGSPPRAPGAAHALLGALALQVALGISTLLMVVPVPLAAAHQAGALIVFTAALFLGHTLRPSRTA